MTKAYTTKGKRSASSVLVQLLRIGLGISDPSEFLPISQSQWEVMFNVAKKQAVIGILTDAIRLLPGGVRPPENIADKFELASLKIEGRNNRLNVCTAKIFGEFSAMGISSCVLKGQGTASLYPNPNSRQSGDIDLWVKGRRKDTLKILRSKWTVGEVWYHHADISPFGPKLEVEVHFVPSWMNSPITNRRLLDFFTRLGDEQFSNYDGALGYAHSRPDFDCVFSAVHIYRHLLLEGVGVRQVMDYYFILRNTSQQGRREAFTFMARRLNMGKFLGALMYVLKEFFDMEDEYLLCRPDNRYGQFFFDEIILSGNFGLMDKRNRYRRSYTKLRKFAIRLERIWNYRAIAPSEVFWSPYYKIRQQLWKLFN